MMITTSVIDDDHHHHHYHIHHLVVLGVVGETWHSPWSASCAGAPAPRPPGSNSQGGTGWRRGAAVGVHVGVHVVVVEGSEVGADLVLGEKVAPCPVKKTTKHVMFL